MSADIVVIEALVFIALFTVMVLFPTIKTVTGVHNYNYPPEIQALLPFRVCGSMLT